MLQLLLGVPVLALPAASASAQVLDTYFAQTGRPAGGIPADQSSQQTDADYAPLGVHVGNFVISPQFRESVGYDTNVNGLNSGGSPVIDSSASLVGRWDGTRTSLSAELNVLDQRYTSLPQQDTTSWSANLGSTLTIGHDQLGLSYDHLNEVQTAGEIGAVTAQPVPYRVDVVSASYTAGTGGRISLQPGLEFRDYSFDGVTLPGSNYTEALRNRTSVQESLVGRYELSPDRNLLLALTGTEIAYANTQLGVPAPDSNGGSVLAGIDYAATGVFRYRLLGGYQVRVYTAGAYGSISAPIVEAAVTWQPSRLTTVVASARRDIEDSLSEAVVGLTYTSGRLDLSHELRRNITVAAFAQAQYAGSHTTTLTAAPAAFGAVGGSQDLYSAGISLSWKLNRAWQLTGSEAFTARTGAGRFDYQDNVSLLMIGLAL